MDKVEILNEILGVARGMSLRTMYETLNTYRELAKEFGLDDAEQSKGVVHWKKLIRAKLKKDEIERERECRKVVRNLGDSYITLIRLGEFDSLADADDYFMWNEYIQYEWREYSPTGQLFTDWYHVFKRHGIYYAYHCVSIDV